LVCLGKENPQEAEIDANTCRKDFTVGEIVEICEFYYEKLSRQKEGLKQYGDNTVVIIDNNGEQPIDVVAKIGKVRELISKETTSV
jgi:hypothetical protein